ncbi:MAG: hypothetical protein BroJett013_30620 [Alphaproteobacteria bacterium]|nr:MAG: hypothetical protein BroJett013_30620 [Alphaproteobacteria bacterium]
MAKTLLKQTFVGDITVVEGEKKLTGVTIVDHFEIVDEDGDTLRKQTPRAASAEELALLLGGETANLVAALETASAQNTALQARVEQLTGALAVADAALEAVANADAVSARAHIAEIDL